MSGAFTYRENLIHASACLSQAAEDLEAAVVKGVPLDVAGVLGFVTLAIMSLADAEPKKCRANDAFRALLEPADKFRALGPAPDPADRVRVTGGVVPLGPVYRTEKQRELLWNGTAFAQLVAKEMLKAGRGAYLDGEVVIANLLDAIRAVAAHDPEQEFADPIVRDIVEMLGPRPDAAPVNDNRDSTGAA